MRGASRSRGFALLAVLWGTALLALLAVALGGSARTEARLARNALAMAEARALADGGARLAMAALAAPGSPLRLDGSVQTVMIGGAAVTVSVIAAAGLVDINAAPPVLLAAMFRAAGAKPDSAARLADAVVRWRGPVQDAEPTMDAAYRAAGLPPPGNRRFEALAELRQVLGIDAALYARAVRLATIQSRRPGIDPRFAPVELLAALPGATPATVASLAARRPLPPNADFAGFGLPPDLIAPGAADVLEIEARAAIPNGPEAIRRATVRLTGMLADPVWLHAWEGGS